jgi:Trk-type K+ transport system membrane component
MSEGLVGVSVGTPGSPISLCGSFTKWGKMLIILCFYMGKNRAMPKPYDDVIDVDFIKLRKAIKYCRTKDRTDTTSY